MFHDIDASINWRSGLLQCKTHHVGDGPSNVYRYDTGPTSYDVRILSSRLYSFRRSQNWRIEACDSNMDPEHILFQWFFWLERRTLRAASGFSFVLPLGPRKKMTKRMMMWTLRICVLLGFAIFLVREERDFCVRMVVFLLCVSEEGENDERTQL